MRTYTKSSELAIETSPNANCGREDSISIGGGSALWGKSEHSIKE